MIDPTERRRLLIFSNYHAEPLLLVFIIIEHLWRCTTKCLYGYDNETF
jgi:hypothetical protein